MGEIFRNVQEQLRCISGRSNETITPDTEIYRDLGLYGDDVAFDVVLWATREFGMEGVFHLNEYVPGESNFRCLRRLVRKLFGLKERQCKVSRFAISFPRLKRSVCLTLQTVRD